MLGLVAGWPKYSHVCVKAWSEGNLKENLELKKENNVKMLNLGPIVFLLKPPGWYIFKF